MGYEEEDDQPLGAVGFVENAALVVLALLGVFAVTCIVLSLERAS